MAFVMWRKKDDKIFKVCIDYSYLSQSICIYYPDEYVWSIKKPRYYNDAKSMTEHEEYIKEYQRLDQLLAGKKAVCLNGK